MGDAVWKQEDGDLAEDVRNAVRIPRSRKGRVNSSRGRGGIVPACGRPKAREGLTELGKTAQGSEWPAEVVGRINSPANSRMRVVGADRATCSIPEGALVALVSHEPRNH